MIDTPPTPFRRMAERFRGYLPVVVDVETGGFDWNRHALLELAAIPIEIDEHGKLVPGEVACAHFDLNFLNAAVARVQHKRNPFHPFSVFDTVSLAGVAYGQTVLARAVQAAGYQWRSEDAHSAVYDAERTAEVFCKIANAWQNP